MPASTTMPYHVAESLRRRRRIATELREALERNKPADRQGFDPKSDYWGDQRSSWYWDRVAEDVAELIDRGKLA